MAATFSTEEMLVEQFVALLEGERTPWGKVRFAREFDYRRGRTDVVAVADPEKVIAVEAKLKGWKRALDQAYRNTCFAHQSFVLLPKAAALAARASLAEFEKRGVGLCYIDGPGIVVLQDSPYIDPLEPWLASEAISHAHGPQAGPAG